MQDIQMAASIWADGGKASVGWIMTANVHLKAFSPLRVFLLDVFLFHGSPDSNNEKMTSRWPSVWVKICSSWVCIALYVWTLVAPLVLVNRDFD